jgi:hypothetical protein
MKELLETLEKALDKIQQESETQNAKSDKGLVNTNGLV